MNRKRLFVGTTLAAIIIFTGYEIAGRMIKPNDMKVTQQLYDWFADGRGYNSVDEFMIDRVELHDGNLLGDYPDSILGRRNYSGYVVLQDHFNKMDWDLVHFSIKTTAHGRLLEVNKLTECMSAYPYECPMQWQPIMEELHLRGRTLQGMKADI